jgi:hypothetical protein
VEASEFMLVPFWEELIYTPVVFVRVANKGVTAYGKRKSAEVQENKRDTEREKSNAETQRAQRLRREADC